MPRPPSFLFRLVGVLAGGFVLTVFVMVAALFSDPDLPLNQWLNRYSLHLLMSEVGLLLFVGFLAMVRDQAKSGKEINVEDATSTRATTKAKNQNETD